MISSFEVWAEGAASSSSGGEVVLTRFASGVAGVLLLAAGGVIYLSAMLRSTVAASFRVYREKIRKRRGARRPGTYWPSLDSCMVNGFIPCSAKFEGALRCWLEADYGIDLSSPSMEQTPLASMRELHFGQL